jgi:hypothetical protein
MRGGRFRQAMPGFVIATVVVVSCVGLAELGLRIWAPIHFVGIQDAYEYDGELGYQIQPGLHRYKLTDHLEEIRTNGLGSVGFEESFAGYPALIFAAGDSYTQGTGLAADASYPFQLGQILNRDATGLYSKRYGIVNLGLAAFGGEQSLITLERYATKLGPPAFVLYLGCDNDYDDDQLFESGYRHQHIVPGSPTWGWAVRPLLWLQGFELVKRGKLAVATLRQARSLGSRPADETARERQGPSPAELEWPVIARIAAFARESGAVLVVSWANLDSGSYPWLEAKAREEGIRFADWRPAVQSVQQAMPELPFANPHSGGHWRTWVNRLIAEAYAREVSR